MRKYLITYKTLEGEKDWPMAEDVEAEYYHIGPEWTQFYVMPPEPPMPRTVLSIASHRIARIQDITDESASRVSGWRRLGN